MATRPDPCRGFRFPAEAIQRAVWLCRRFGLSPRGVGATLAARGVVVGREGVRGWGLRFGLLFANTLKRRRPRPGDKRRMDGVSLSVRGKLLNEFRLAALIISGKAT